MRLWWGIKVDGELIAVISKMFKPHIYDFDLGCYGSSTTYEIVEVEVNEL